MSHNSATKPNKFPGDCDRCGERVPGGEGLLAGRRGKRWQVRHITCNHEGAREGPAQVAIVGPACGLTGVQLDPTIGGLEGRNLDRRIRAADKQREQERVSRELAADEDEHARNLQMVAGF